MKLSKTQLLLCFFFLSIILCIPAFYNGFPIFFPDTASYIDAGFTNHVQRSRPWLYSGFIRHISMWESLWFVIIAQGMISSVVIYLMFKAFYKGNNKVFIFILYVLLTGMTTALSFHVSRLMPDIFTPLVILTFVWLLLAKDVTKKEQAFMAIIFIVSSAMHNAHIIMNLGLVICLFLGGFLKSIRSLYTSLGLTAKRMGVIVLLIISTHLFICTLHYSKDGNFEATKGGAIFLFARLCDLGIAQSYLEENCEAMKYPICDQAGSLFYSGGFLWESHSVFNKSGGWTKENEAFYKRLTLDILTTPKYFKAYVIRCIESMFEQFFQCGYSPVEPHIKWVTGSVKHYYPMYILSADGSKQVKNTYNQYHIDVNNTIQNVVLGLSLLLLFFLFWDPNYAKEQKVLTILILLGMLINAFISGATSGIFDRYQSRVVWLVTLPAFWYTLDWLKRKKNIEIKL